MAVQTAAEPIKIAILGVGDNTARIGIQAPRNIRVDRAEIDDRRRKVGGSDLSVGITGRGYQDTKAVCFQKVIAGDPASGDAQDADKARA